MLGNGIYSRGIHTFQVSAKLHELNRKSLVEALLKSGAPKNSLVLLQGGESTTRYCSDHEPVFRQESFFHWAFGVEEPDFYGCISLKDGKSYLFPPKLPDCYEIWMGKLHKTDDFKKRYLVDQVHFDDVISDIVNNINPDLVLTLKGLNSDSGKTSREAVFDGLGSLNVDNNILYDIISNCRVYKNPLELELLRYINRISSEAHKEVMRRILPGMEEYQLESIFQHYSYFNGGARFMSYTCICGTGENGAILHYGHAGAPNNKTVRDGDMCLFDMGAEYNCYSSDITCSFPVNGKFTEKQKIIYNAVLKSSRAVMKAVKPGVSWVDMHLLADRIHLEELKKHGLLKGNIDEMMKERIGAIFMPHGLGHFMGIDTHDVGGYLKDCPPRHIEDGLKNLRTARVLEANMVLTIEPGIYFIDKLLDNAYSNPSISKFLVKDELDNFRNFGGVRIEDDVIITEDGMELMTDVPRTVEEIESFMEIEKKIEPFPQKKFFNK